MNETIGRTPPQPPTPAESPEVEEQQLRPHHVPNITYNSIVDKLPHNIIRCKAYGIPNAQNKTCKMLNGS